MPDRPPSERTPEYQLIDAVAALTDELRELKARPNVAPLVQPVNWWDVLPADVRPEALIGEWQQLHMQRRDGSYGSFQLDCRGMSDRIELSLSDNQGRMLWRRCLFYQPISVPA